MTREEFIRSVETYRPWNEQEAADQAVILEHLYKEEDVFERSNLTAHLTASAWVTNARGDKVLMAYHNLYDSWSWLGGHSDGETDQLAVAMKEVREESGIQNVYPVSEDIFSLEILTVEGHVKRGHYVPSHLHLNVTYLLEADEDEALKVKADENSALAWFDLEEAVEASSEPWFRDHIYSKLNEKLKEQSKK